jgi:co-chaperonin GroES (HSP10)
LSVVHPESTTVKPTPLHRGGKQLLVVGDRVLVEPQAGEDRTNVGLLLPASAVEKEAVQGGRVVALGPGTPLPPLTEDDNEPWRQSQQQPPRFLPMQVQIGDYAVFFRKAAIEIAFETRKYLVVPHGAILVLVREGGIPDTVPDEI